jgi:hypothetical protein
MFLNSSPSYRCLTVILESACMRTTWRGQEKNLNEHQRITWTASLYQSKLRMSTSKFCRVKTNQNLVQISWMWTWRKHSLPPHTHPSQFFYYNSIAEERSISHINYLQYRSCRSRKYLDSLKLWDIMSEAQVIKQRRGYCPSARIMCWIGFIFFNETSRKNGVDKRQAAHWSKRSELS